MTETSELLLHPIGRIHTPFASRYDAPHQPGGRGDKTEGLIALYPNRNFEQALEDLEGIEYIWLLYWFDRNSSWKPKVLVPRGERKKRGVFATRSPHRPNPIGLSLVRLISVRGLELRVGDVDLLDGTPILDIKPYLSYLEAKSEAKAGWIDSAHTSDAFMGYTVRWSVLAKDQVDFLDLHGVPLREHITPILSRDPSPHPYRRIEEAGERLTIGYRSWRADFTVENGSVTIMKVRSGYPLDQLSGEDIDAREAHLAFHARWPATKS